MLPSPGGRPPKMLKLKNCINILPLPGETPPLAI